MRCCPRCPLAPRPAGPGRRGRAPASLTLEGTRVRYSAGIIWSVSMFCAREAAVHQQVASAPRGRGCSARLLTSLVT